MVGTDSRARPLGAVERPRSAIVALLFSLAILLPMLPSQPVVAGPARAPATSLRAQQPDQLLIAFLRQGNLWLMNEDGSDQRQITISEGGVQRFSWSPSGQYIAIMHESRLVLYDVTTGELRDLIEMPNETPYPQGRFPSWAVDADELLMEVSEGSSTYSIVRIGLDGTTTPVSSYTQQQPCGGPSGAMTIMIDLLWTKELGSPFARDAYQDIVWWAGQDIAYFNPLCATGVALDLVTGAMSEYPETVWLDGSADGRVLIQGYPLVGGAAAGIFDPATGTTTPVDGGEVLAWSPTGEIVTTTITRGQESAFASNFDEVSGGYVDNTVDVWRTDNQGGNRQLVTTLDVQGTGVPSIASDGAIIVGAVDNPTALMDVDESQFSEYLPEIYAEHQKILRIDADGEVTLLLTNAYRPRLQPIAGAIDVMDATSDEDGPIDLTGTPEATAESTEIAAQPVSTSADGWIAYAGRDGNIWLARPDGSDQRQVTTDGAPDRPYIHPNWSPDGTMLVFSTRNGQEETGNDIYLLRDGAVTRVPSIHNCSSAAFTADGARLLMLCATKRSSSPVSDTYPPDSFVSVADLDGSNWEVVAPFPLEIDGSDPLWWSKLFTSDISVSPLDGEILVNSIFMSSARVPQIQLIDGTGEWDAIFGAPPEEPGRVWGTFSADGTNILTRICRGCYKDSPGPPNAAILLLDRDGNVIETLYTPDPDALIDGFVQSPDGSRLLVSSTTEETDFDFGTAGLTYTTQMVDIASGTVTDVPIDGGGFAWQPAAVDVAVPESTAGLQPTTQFLGTAPVVAIACTTTSEGFLLSAETLILPEGCEVAEGMRFTVSGANGEQYGQCVIGSAAYCSQPEIWMPVDVEVTVTVDASTIPEGYAVVGGSPQKFTFESKYLNTDAAQWLIVLMPADVAVAQGGAPEVTETATEVATKPGSASGLVIEPGQDWIAYVGEDGNIWLMQPDGSQQLQATTDGTREAPYAWPTWSHDGTMLVFARRPSADSGESATIHILRDGVVSRVQNVQACNAAAFMPGDQQLVLGCGSDFPPSGASDTAMQTDPALGFVSMVNLDGSDWHVHVPYHRAAEGVWPNHAGGPDMAWVESVSVHPDGTILLSFSGFHGHGLALLEPGSTTPTVLLSPLGRGGVVGRYFPGSDEILIGACKGCYPRANSGDPEFTIAWMDRNGVITTPLYVPDPLQEMGMPTISPDGGTLVFSTNRSIQSLDLATGSQVTIGTGTAVSWQPNASVTMERPAAPVTSGAGSSTGAATPVTSGQPPAQAAPTGAVPDRFIATWSGWGVQENPYGEWAVTISITGGGVGDIVGTSEYPEESCGGNLILQEVTADAIVLLEQLTYGQETCADNGTITLSVTGEGICQFAWSGIGPYGTPSSAGGPLFRPESATASSAPASSGSASPSGDQGYGPAVDTTQLDPYYIQTFSGTGNQTDPDNTWPITVTFTGGHPGEVIGTVEYPTLGCGGELILVSINPVDEWRGFEVTERITYGLDNCIDGGTFWFSMAESGIGITFGWESPTSATRASGHLPEAESGASSVPADQGTESSSGPPSNYDDPEAEPVPIEAEDGG